MILVRWRRMTITGMIVATTSSGHRAEISQPGRSRMAVERIKGKLTDATMLAREMYRQIRTTTTQTPKARAAQLV